MKTALLVIDMQNAFIKEGGENFYPDAPKVIEPVARLIAAAEKAGAIVVHVADRHRPGFTDFEQIRLPQHGLHGSEDAAFYEGFGPHGYAHEIVIEKRRYSAFFATELGLFLREQGVERVVIAGVKTNVCVRATAQDAFANGLAVVVVPEATNSNRAHLAAGSLEDIDRYLGKAVALGDAEKLFA